ncbi:MAG: hypothetical protein OIF58_10880, partial [Cohaesibacter sp.]|nr:hypothetical protein [Cohaesibacter sp.]
SKFYAFGLPMQDIISLFEARPEWCAGGDGKGQFARGWMARDAWKWDKMDKIQEAFGSVG